MKLSNCLISTFMEPISSFMEGIATTIRGQFWIITAVLNYLASSSGANFAVPVILSKLKTSVMSALVVLTQYLGSSLFISFGDTIFSATLPDALGKYAPTVDAEAVIAAGGRGMRNVVAAAELPGVLKAYNEALNRTFVRISCKQSIFFLLFSN